MPSFEAEAVLPHPREQVFDFLLRPANVVLISPPGLGLHFVDPPEVVAQGSRLRFRVQGFGQIRESEHEITTVTPHSFVLERQVKGLFQKWHHEHLFEIAPHGQTRVIDRIDFTPPGGVLGMLVTAQRVLEQLEDGFEDRHARLARLLAKQSNPG